MRGTILHGIAKKAIDTFELLFRNVVNLYRELVERTGKENIRTSGKPFERATFGELIKFGLVSQKCSGLRGA